ncbi:HXXEE domain-containing protein [Streptomyces sp. NPDC052396]|uniref:HXXEE domain-containing protein n=1 Tax=Streptomyces sp. NPDC052396 TaxID=3365689 RepID=UPI0037D516ED
MDQRVGPAVTFGLLAAWALNDIEELATMDRFTRERLPVLRARFPRVPERIWGSMAEVDGRRFAVAVGVMGAIVAAAAADGHRTGGRSPFYRATLDGFGLHGLVHLAQAAASRGYTPGVLTSPTVVVPFTLWARTRLRRAGALPPPRARDAAYGLALAGAAAVVSHTVARRLTARTGRRPVPGRSHRP